MLTPRVALGGGFSFKTGKVRLIHVVAKNLLRRAATKITVKPARLHTTPNHGSCAYPAPQASAAEQIVAPTATPKFSELEERVEARLGASREALRINVLSGATAAMKAGIPLIGYVGVYGIEESQEKMEKMAKILTDECKADVIMYDWKEFPECMKKIENRS